MKFGNESLKALNRLFSLEDVERIMDETAEAVEYQAEIDSLLSGADLTREDEDAVQAHSGSHLNFGGKYSVLSASCRFLHANHDPSFFSLTGRALPLDAECLPVKKLLHIVQIERLGYEKM